MKVERSLPRRWAYRGLQVAIAAGGVAAIVGSGGGGFFAIDCPSTICQQYVYVNVEPLRQTAQVGQNVTFRGVTSGTVPVQQYQWCRAAPGSSTCVAIPGATGSTLTVQNATLADDQARYELTVTGSGTSHTDSGQLLVSTAPAVVFQDGEFLGAGWAWSGFVGSGQGVPSSAVRVSRQTSGGNPGAYLAIEYGPLSSADRLLAAHTSLAATYDPGQFGAIYSIDFRAECKAFSGYGERMSVSPMLKQGARTYTAWLRHQHYCGEPGWTFESVFGSIVVSDFAQILDGPPCGAGEACPDFSAAGAPITFGMHTVNDYVDPGAAGVASQGVDNWRVSVWRR